MVDNPQNDANDWERGLIRRENAGGFGDCCGFLGSFFTLSSRVLYIEDDFQGELESRTPGLDDVHFAKNGSSYAFTQEEGCVARRGYPSDFLDLLPAFSVWTRDTFRGCLRRHARYIPPLWFSEMRGSISKVIPDWATMVEDMSASKGNALTGAVHALAEVVLETKHRTAIVPSLPPASCDSRPGEIGA
jgi:hypothetical protein